MPRKITKRKINFPNKSIILYNFSIKNLSYCHLPVTQTNQFATTRPHDEYNRRGASAYRKRRPAAS